MAWGTDRGASTVIGVLLLVGVAVVVGGIVAVGALTFLDNTGAPTANADFSYEQTPAGLEMRPKAIGTTVTVQLNGRDVATFTPDSAGQSALLPTAPGDRVTVVSRDGERSVLVDRTVDDRSEVGDFIAYYTFDEGSGTTLVDRSGNGNDGSFEDDDGESGPEWDGCGLRFDGDSEYVTVDDITTDGTDDVREFTVAVSYTQTGKDGTVNQLVEHRFGGDEWFLETSPGPYSIDYAVEYPAEVASSTGVSVDRRHVVVGTYDGNEYDLYVDGTRVGGGTHTERVGMGEMRLGRDYESASQYLQGDICEMRLYYRAFAADEVAAITNAME